MTMFVSKRPSSNDAQRKVGIASESIFPRIAFLDASYTGGLPSTVTINTVIDALSHAVEGYLSNRATPISDVFAAESIKIIGTCLDEIKSGHIEFDIREKLLYASMVAGIVIAHTGTTALHAMGYSLTYFKNIDHGRANGILMYEYLTYISGFYGERIAGIVRLLGLNSLLELEGVMDSLLGDKEVITPDETKLFASIAAKAKNITNTSVRPNQNDLQSIIEKSFI